MIGGKINLHFLILLNLPNKYSVIHRATLLRVRFHNGMTCHHTLFEGEVILSNVE